MKVKHHFFKEHRLLGVFRLFNDSPYQVINTLCPGDIKLWELANVRINYWKNPGDVKQTMEWFHFKKLNYSSYDEGLFG